MLKTLFLLIGLYFLVKYIRGLFLPSRKRNNYFNPFGGFYTNMNSGSRSNAGGGSQRNSRKSRSGSFEQIEEAEYEDISDKDN